MPTYEQLLTDKEFVALPDSGKMRVMGALDPDGFGVLSPQAKVRVFGKISGNPAYKDQPPPMGTPEMIGRTAMDIFDPTLNRSNEPPRLTDHFISGLEKSSSVVPFRDPDAGGTAFKPRPDKIGPYPTENQGASSNLEPKTFLEKLSHSIGEWAGDAPLMLGAGVVGASQGMSLPLAFAAPAAVKSWFKEYRDTGGKMSPEAWSRVVMSGLDNLAVGAAGGAVGEVGAAIGGNATSKIGKIIGESGGRVAGEGAGMVAGITATEEKIPNGEELAMLGVPLVALHMIGRVGARVRNKAEWDRISDTLPDGQRNPLPEEPKKGWREGESINIQLPADETPPPSKYTKTIEREDVPRDETPSPKATDEGLPSDVISINQARKGLRSAETALSEAHDKWRDSGGDESKYGDFEKARLQVEEAKTAVVQAVKDWDKAHGKADGEIRLVKQAEEPIAETTVKNEPPYIPEGVSPPTETQESTKPIPGVEGRDTYVKTGNDSLPAKYKVVEDGSIFTSHNHQNFAETPGYPQEIQPRRYNEDKQAQGRVIENANKFDPNIILSDSPTATDGPPVILPGGNIIGGNGRTMSMRRAAESGEGAAYRETLKREAAKFGIDATEIDKFKNPVLVRELRAEPKDEGTAHRLGVDLNKPLTGEESSSQKAVSMSKLISDETFHGIGEMIDASEGATINKVLSENGREVVEMLLRDRALSKAELPKYYDQDGITASGKTLITDALLGRIVKSSSLISNMPDSVMGKISGSLAPFTRLQRHPKWDLTADLQAAVRSVMQAKDSRMNAKQYLAQQSMFDEGMTPKQKALFTALMDDGQRAFKRRIADYADAARKTEEHRPAENQEALFAEEVAPLSPDEAFNKAFNDTAKPETTPAAADKEEVIREKIAEIVAPMFDEKRLEGIFFGKKGVIKEADRKHILAAVAEELKGKPVTEQSMGNVVHTIADDIVRDYSKTRQFATQVVNGYFGGDISQRAYTTLSFLDLPMLQELDKKITTIIQHSASGAPRPEHSASASGNRGRSRAYYDRMRNEIHMGTGATEYNQTTLSTLGHELGHAKDLQLGIENYEKKFNVDREVLKNELRELSRISNPAIWRLDERGKNSKQQKFYQADRKELFAEGLSMALLDGPTVGKIAPEFTRLLRGIEKETGEKMIGDKKYKGGTILYSGVSPAEPIRNFAEQSVKPSLKTAAWGIVKTADDIRKTFAAPSRGEQAKYAAGVIRENAAKLAQKALVARESVKTFAKALDEMPQPEQLDFIHKMETIQPQKTGELSMAADVLRSLLDGRWLIVGKLSGIRTVIEGFFPHLWEDPKSAGGFWKKTYGKRPLEGAKTFAKKRVYETTREGIEAGLKPVTTNPVELVLLKVYEMDKYIMGQEIFRELKANGLAQFVRATERAPDGFERINDKIARVYGGTKIPVKEYVDQNVYDDLLEVATSLGIKHERVAGFGRKKALGLSYQGANRIETKFATDLSVLAHEIGHQLDHKYGLWDRIVTEAEGVGKKGTVTKTASAKMRATIGNELRELADLNWERQTPSENYKKKVRNQAEKIAHILQAYIHAPDRLEQVAPNVYKSFRDILISKPELRPILDIQPGLALKEMQTKIPAGGLIVKGEFMAPEPVAKILNNYLSPGLRGNPAYEVMRGTGNLMNQVQLGVSAFHLTFTSVDAVVSSFALGLQEIGRGQFKRGLKHINPTNLVTQPFKNYIKGNKALKAYYENDPQGKVFADITDALIKAGGRVKMDSFYHNSAVESFWKALDTKNPIAAVGHAIPAAIQAMAYPIMEHIVPRQKLGVFADMAESQLEHWRAHGIEPSVAEQRAVFGKMWDSVDNRMGQLVYDNLFWNKVVKDIGLISSRSLGWNLGTFRELGGGVLDVKDIRKINGGYYISPRTAYVVALPAVTALYGAIINYLKTGNPPDETKDYFYPKTGKLLPNGQAERVAIASYMKDIYAYKNDIEQGHPLRTIGHKLHPLLAAMGERIENKDFFGTQIHPEDEDKIKWLESEAKFWASNFVPFSIAGMQQRDKQGVTTAEKAESFMGLVPAPAYITNSKALNVAADILGNKLSGGPGTTKEQFEKKQVQKQIADLTRQHKPIPDDLKSKLKAMPDRDYETTIDKGLHSVLENNLKYMMAKEAMKVWDVATPEERKQIKGMVKDKIYNAFDNESISREKMKEYLARLKPSAVPQSPSRTH